MRRPLAAICAITAALVLSAAPAAAAPADDRDPVVFIHGFAGKGDQWSSMRQTFIDNGYRADRLHVFSYDWARSNETIAARLGDFVRQVRSQTGAGKVDLVTHSMGGLSSRWYIKFLGGESSVDDWVSLGGPNNGTSVANLCWSAITPCEEMRRGSDFIDRLNAGDPTPGDVDYGTFRSPCDLVISPVDSTVLPGATNTEVGCMGHIYMMYSSSVADRVHGFVR